MENNDKFNLIVKPCQSGKTFVLLYEIKRLFQMESNDKNIVHIFFCDNSLLQTEQLKSRIDNDDELSQIIDTEGELSVILSSKSIVKSFDALLTAIFFDECNNIITCANESRINQINKLMNTKNSKFIESETIKYFLWIDESDKTFTDKMKSIYLKKWAQMENVEKITFITATPDTHFKSQFSVMNIFTLEDSHNPETYHMFKDSNFVYIKNETKDTFENIEYVISTYESKNGEVWFVPGNSKTSSHIEIKNYLMSQNFYVFLINGESKALYYQDKIICTLDDIKDYDELAKKLGSIYEKYNLKNQKVAITGNICISRGITISSDKMLITHGILPPIINDGSTAYQLAGRLCGNFKNLPNFRVPTIFVTQNSYTIKKYCNKKRGFNSIKDIICNMERMSCELSKYENISSNEYFREKDKKSRIYYVRSNDLTVIKTTIHNFILSNGLYEKYKSHFSDDEKMFKEFMKKKFKKIVKTKPFEISDFSHTSKSDKNERDSKGFMKNLLREDFQVMNSSKVFTDRKWGVDEKTIARFHVSYDNLLDINSVQYWITFMDPEYILSTEFTIEYIPNKDFHEEVNVIDFHTDIELSTVLNSISISEPIPSISKEKKVRVPKKKKNVDPTMVQNTILDESSRIMDIPNSQFSMKIFDHQDDLFTYYEENKEKYIGRKPIRKKPNEKNRYLCNSSKGSYFVDLSELINKIDNIMDDHMYKNVCYYIDKNDLSSVKFGFVFKKIKK